ncbi:Long-chain fatty acid transport protein [hydrothermal vent metagenome]|uniref:Long-chain fatty acid transport protein n=1 Tax=hydrothermal vent metagenome TaxID=652676 RepID=A0A3B0YG62_9ZZZZ
MSTNVKLSKLKSAKKVAVLAISTAIASGFFHSSAQAAGFQLIENSARGQGNAFAGAAATANDASTVWFNPAGMTKLKNKQVSVAGHVIVPDASFTNNGSTDGSGNPLNGANDDGGRTALVGNLYWVTDVGETKFGLGITTPFGLTTEYDDTWVGRYLAVKTDMKTINFNPSIAREVTDKLSIGGGINILLADITITNAVDFGSLLGDPQNRDGFAKLEADNLTFNEFSWGVNLGLTYDFTNDTRLGLAWRSEIVISVAGKADFSVPANAAPVLGSGAFQDTNIKGRVTLPQSFSMSLKQDISDVTLLADITWTGWSSFDELRIQYENPFQPDSVTTQSWDDTFRYSLGADYKVNNTLTLRSGIAYDETPVPSAQRRTPRIPGNDRTWLSFGLTYVMSPAIIMDFGYSHLFISDANINNTFESGQPALEATINGTYEASVDIFSAQLTWNYDL